MDDLIDNCLVKVKDTKPKVPPAESFVEELMLDEPTELSDDEGEPERMETIEDHFTPNYCSQPKKNDLREITNAFKIKSYMGRYWYQPG